VIATTSGRSYPKHSPGKRNASGARGRFKVQATAPIGGLGFDTGLFDGAIHGGLLAELLLSGILRDQIIEVGRLKFSSRLVPG
jgi:hypothetical protein